MRGADSRELECLREYYGQTEAMRKSILAWMAGEPTANGWVFPHGSKELREALSKRQPIVRQQT